MFEVLARIIKTEFQKLTQLKKNASATQGEDQ